MRLNQEKKLKFRRSLETFNQKPRTKVYNFATTLIKRLKFQVSYFKSSIILRAIFLRFLIFILIFAWIFSGWPRIWEKPAIPPEIEKALAAVANDAASESHTGTTGNTSAASFTWTHTPVGTPRGVLVFVYTISATKKVTGVTYGGVAMTEVSGGAAVDTATEPGRVDTFFLGASVPTGARSVVVNRTNDTTIMYATAQTQTAGTDTEVTGIILLQENQALAEQSVNDGSTGVNSVRYAGAYSGLAAPPTVGANSTLLNNIDLGAYGVSTVRETTAGQGARLVGFTAATDDVAAVHLAVRERTTTIATGSDPAAATIAPEAAATDVNQFTLQTANGTETITSVTVNLSTNSGIGLLAITDNANTVLGSTASPVTGSNTISVSGMSAISGSATTFKVRVTPLSHAAMPAPAGGAYAITAPVTAWAGNYTGHVGSDTNTNALTIDNASPADVTGASGTAGDQQVSLSWTNPGDSDFHSTVVLRRTNTAVGDTPVEGTTYIVGNTIGLSTVACVVLSPTASCTDTGLINGTPYHYKIFTRDNNVNYSTPGVIPTGSPFTPAAAGTLTVDIVDAGGTSVPSPTMAMGAVTFSFSYQTANGTFGVSTQKIRVNNTTASPAWTLTIAASGGPDSLWSAGTPKYDFNDPTANAEDGSDSPDTVGGQMTINPLAGTITPQGGCSNTDVNLQSSNSFSEDVTNNITLIIAGSSAQTNCYWDLTGVSISQTIPASQSIDTYTLDLTLTVI